MLKAILWMRPLQVSVFAWDLGRESALQGREALQVVAQFGDLQHLTRVGPSGHEGAGAPNGGRALPPKVPFPTDPPLSFAARRSQSSASPLSQNSGIRSANRPARLLTYFPPPLSSRQPHSRRKPFALSSLSVRGNGVFPDMMANLMALSGLLAVFRMIVFITFVLPH